MYLTLFIFELSIKKYKIIIISVKKMEWKTIYILILLIVIIFLCLRNYQLRLRLRRCNLYEKKIEHYSVSPAALGGGYMSTSGQLESSSMNSNPDDTSVNESFMGGGWMATSGNLDNPPKLILDSNQMPNQNLAGNLLILGLFFGLAYGFYFWINHKKK